MERNYAIGTTEGAAEKGILELCRIRTTSILKILENSAMNSSDIFEFR